MERTLSDVKGENSDLRQKAASSKSAALESLEQGASMLPEEQQAVIMQEISSIRTALEEETQQKEGLADEVRRLREQQTVEVDKAVAEVGAAFTRGHHR